MTKSASGGSPHIAALTVEDGSTVYGRGMKVSSHNGFAVSVDGASWASLEGSQLGGHVEIKGKSTVHLDNALVSYGLPPELVADAKAMSSKGNNAGAISMILTWARNNISSPEKLNSIFELFGNVRSIEL